MRKRDVWQTAVRVAAVWATSQVTLFLLLTRQSPREHAVAMMAGGLFLLWCVLGGWVMWRHRELFTRWIGRWRWRWQIKFVLLCTLFALVEEAITTGMTNLAPLFGVRIGEAYITASTNYLDVVLWHSVVVFVPMFVCWAWMLSRWAFAPRQVMVLFGVTGILAEAVSFGLHNLLGWGFWLLVYGLMVYLPTYAVREEVGSTPPRGKHYLMAVLLPFLFAAPVAGLIGWLHPVTVHFAR
ncbi:MAG: hypothetical protein RMM08_10235 [Armatimonadota bacterium]|nr:hypothetical protein [bacterium]MDW8321730.1 hypothetical protein [Armatimonadota bacterium]